MKKIILGAVLALFCFAGFAEGPIATKIISTVGLQPKKNFEILKAAFGTKELSFDMTPKVKKAVETNQKYIRADAETFGRPIPLEAAKVLEIGYTTNNQLKAISVNENELLDLSLLK